MHIYIGRNRATGALRVIDPTLPSFIPGVWENLGKLEVTPAGYAEADDYGARGGIWQHPAQCAPVPLFVFPTVKP